MLKQLFNNKFVRSNSLIYICNIITILKILIKTLLNSI